MINIIIPMAGEGKRFSDAGYKKSKPTILTYDRHSFELKPMVVCAAGDLPGIGPKGENILFIDRDYHKQNGVEAEILNTYPMARFISLNHLTEGQACTCLKAKDFINNDKELLIAGCDNGMDYSEEKFEQLKREADVIVFTYRHNEAVLEKPDAYGWMKIDSKNNITEVSVKKAISDNPMNDHAVVSTFWFKRGKIFVESTEKMIKEQDKVNNEYYVDQVIKHALDLGYRAKVFEIDRYICWGTPYEYELYQKTYEYWDGFYKEVIAKNEEGKNK